MYEQQTWRKLLDEMLEGLQTSQVAKREGTFVYDVLSPAALQLEQVYEQLEDVLRLGFAETTNGPYLDMRADEHGLQRKAPEAAQGSVRFSGRAGSVITKGAIVATASGTLFQTTQEVVFADSQPVRVDITAVELGGSGNVPAGLINTVITELAGVQSVTNDSSTYGGYDGETDSELLARLLAKVRNPATSGNVDHYMQWAMDIAGIGDAKVFPVWNGPGTVKVVLLSTEQRAPAQGLIDEVKQHIEKMRPIGAEVTIVAAKEVPVHIEVDVSLTQEGTDLALVRAEIERSATDYLGKLAFRDPVVRIARIANAVLDSSSVLDYTSLRLNGGTQNLVLEADQVAVLGTVKVV
ncbi:baseplate J/gp47 family protein [Paenibacillus arenosi]|uniref:Baseplate J/gp47 family protein n=1 Tax=Paenibacillus arenosi TaxID=2774142 RepID=A0ABR9B309_9BACL|nr:baseplate J/gp47 family protein [Paenibacillus arenosi]MBD8500748.1 baseplate J/gp47 family protein [Paenibacillus arenosi]